MPENPSTDSLKPPDPDEQDSLRALNRTPHPYHHQSEHLPYAADHFDVRSANESLRPRPNGNGTSKSPRSIADAYKESSPGSDSGTEADDEHFLKGLPAPKTRLHKGLRGQNEHLSDTPSPMPSPTWTGKEAKDYTSQPIARQQALGSRILGAVRRNKNLTQRATEAGIVTFLSWMVMANEQVQPLVKTWKRDFELLGLIYTSLLAMYSVRVAIWGYRKRNPTKFIPLRLPANFDPAPILWPPAVTLCVSLLVATDNPAVILPNMILSICTWPQQIIPKFELGSAYDSVHWALTCLPLVWSASRQNVVRVAGTHAFVSNEEMVLLYPLHQTLCVVLHHLTTTSLLTAELQLFSVALINVLILASSPQIYVLKSLLWVGGLGMLVTCSGVIKSGIILARVPKWRFRKIPGHGHRPLWKELSKVFSWRRIKSEFFGSMREARMDDVSTSDDEVEYNQFKTPKRTQTLGAALNSTSKGRGGRPSDNRDFQPSGLARSQTLSYANDLPQIHHSHTSSGRKKRSTSVTLRPFLKLTYTQAVIRKWLYALHVYSMLGVVILGGIRTHMQLVAFKGKDPIGWALGYLFGDLPAFRFQVVNANLERWICLPERTQDEDKLCHMGWVQHVRHNDFGEANTRLLLAAYWAIVVIVGLVVVFRLQNIYEVDTRRKVFHFMMVGILLPGTFIDPTFAALVLAIVLAIFLGLDLLRASQLPPLSKPIASFLAPYVDGRDFRGPVVISHIFLLIGCAIPLWLALAALPRSGAGSNAGWEVPTREVSMVSGVICVGLGDAAASLIGRRYGRRKWIWGGGKSLEGSLAFAVAVFVGLAAASIWLRVGGWPIADERAGVLQSARNAAVCGTVASLTEAVLTGGNDNVIVPVVLWTCVKSLAI
ncbi:Dolichol kinase-like protein [Emericellopsis cladophorae]|uniref:dolichol kinase n=1 Tax=Emericellopsis cladophorae TaxID=2686198 RepID=A0A9P9Y2Z0_9HYPO|nr:Dolichol kinase-like protein [Emericellopsis cladophorae]KAI6782401.1 Dolichol kinase-like protein [Emericellopsis cladophorae]